MAFIDKPACNPKIVPCKVVDIRVPMGAQQAALYGHFLDRGNIPGRSAYHRAGKQVAYLRNICADPAGFTHGGPSVASNFNPKTVAVLELVAKILHEGQQVVLINSRCGQTTTLVGLLVDCGIRVARIDSTVPARQHAYQASVFKRGKADVLAMGIKCASAHSFPDCPNEIIGSLEYSFGTFEQARGRVYRVNSKVPVTVYCVLHANSIEEVQYDVCMTKGDAANICLHGKRVPRTFIPADIAEILADSYAKFSTHGAPDELELFAQAWPKVSKALSEGRALTPLV
jgi:hypothetical protein